MAKAQRGSRVPQSDAGVSLLNDGTQQVSLGKRLLSAIQRALWEETGYTAEEWIELGDFHPAPAYSDEFITMYMARKLRKGERHLDADEFLDVYTVPLKDLVEDVMAGKISDAKTQVCILKAARLLGL